MISSRKFETIVINATVTFCPYQISCSKSKHNESYQLLWYELKLKYNNPKHIWCIQGDTYWNIFNVRANCIENVYMKRMHDSKKGIAFTHVKICSNLTHFTLATFWRSYECLLYKKSQQWGEIRSWVPSKEKAGWQSHSGVSLSTLLPGAGTMWLLALPQMKIVLKDKCFEYLRCIRQLWYHTKGLSEVLQKIARIM